MACSILCTPRSISRAGQGTTSARTWCLFCTPLSLTILCSPYRRFNISWGPPPLSTIGLSTSPFKVLIGLCCINVGKDQLGGRGRELHRQRLDLDRSPVSG